MASTGLSLALVMTSVLVGAGAWALSVERDAARLSESDRLRSVARVLARSVEGELGANRMAGARAVLSETMAQEGLSSCRVVLPGGVVLLDAGDPSKSERAMPDVWPRADLTEAEPSGGRLAAHTVLDIPGHGPAALELEARQPVHRLGSSRLALGLGLIGVAGLACALLTYRAMRRRVRGIGAIGEALRAAAGGEGAVGALQVSESFGDEARAWNTLLAEREALRRGVLSEELSKALAGRDGGGESGELGAACDALWLGLVLLDESAHVRYINGAATALLGAGKDGLGRDFTALAEDPRLVEAVRAASAGQTRQRVSVEVKVAGERASTLRFTVRPMRRDESVSAMVLVEDVTQQRVADESRNAFVAQVTHELRTPLTNIRLYLDTLAEQGAEDAAVRAKCVNVIVQESRRLERVVADMLSVSEIEAGSFKLHRADVRLDALFEELAADYTAQAQDKEIVLKFELPPKMPVITGDRDKIALAVHNLIGNALKYTPVGGQVTVKVEERAGDVLVHVTDNGIGIRPEESEMIFEKFYRAKDKRIAAITGSGLGLALARQVARMHGGEITVRSQLDKGSTFTIALPMGPRLKLAQAA